MSLPTPDETLHLVKRIQDGDRVAWDDLYRRYHDELLFMVRMNLGERLRSALESEDVLQSVALDAFKALEGFESRGKGSLRHFLNKMVLNKIRDRADHFGAQKRSGAVPLTDTMLGGLGTDAAPQYHDADRFARLERALKQLPDEMRRVILLRKIDDLPSKDVAERMDLSDAAVRKLYSRAMAKLTMLMGGAEG